MSLIGWSFGGISIALCCVVGNASTEDDIGGGKWFEDSTGVANSDLTESIGDTDVDTGLVFSFFLGVDCLFETAPGTPSPVRYFTRFRTISWHPWAIFLFTQFLQGRSFEHCRCFWWQNTHALTAGFRFFFSCGVNFLVIIKETGWGGQREYGFNTIRNGNRWMGKKMNAKWDPIYQIFPQMLIKRLPRTKSK